MKEQSIRWIQIIIGGALLCGLCACVEQEPIPSTSQLPMDTNDTKPKENTKTSPSTKDKTGTNTTANINTRPISQAEMSNRQNTLETISGEQSTEKVEDNGRTYRAVIIYKPGTKIKHGKETLYYLDGGVAQVAFYVDDKREGLYQIFSQKGVLVYEAYYRAGRLNGLCRLFDAGNGKLRSEMNFVDDVLEGEMKIYDTSGALWYILEYKNGKKDGIAKEFDEKGRAIREVPYRNDEEIKR